MAVRRTITVMYKPIILIVLDGWGISEAKDNVLRTTKLPTIEKLNRYYPMIALQASGISVGLPWGEAGNSEVGHMTMGAGKIIYQNLPRISLSIQDGSFFANPVLLKALANVKEHTSALHLMGLISDGAVHAHLEHLYALLEAAKNNGVTKIFIHAFTDGRDASPNAGARLIKDLGAKLKLYGCGTIASLCGRHWAMDRNNNWDRVEKAYKLLTRGEGTIITDPIAYLQEMYAKNVSDEYVQPAMIKNADGSFPVIKENDSVIFFNFREDRARELTKAFILPGFEKFERGKRMDVEFVTMTEYEKDLPVDIIFPPEEVHNGLGEVLSRHRKKQLRIAETEKYAHVTYFFNGGLEEPWPGEDRVLVPSAAVERFDEVPEMSAPQITEKVIDAVKQEKYDFILINYANADMVAHTGNEEAARDAVRALDKSLSLLIPVIFENGGCIFVTSDHGNVETMKNFQTGEVDTEHNPSPVPLWFLTESNHREKKPEEIVRQESEVRGLLSDIAPTIVEILGIPKPQDMHGESLLEMLK